MEYQSTKGKKSETFILVCKSFSRLKKIPVKRRSTQATPYTQRDKRYFRYSLQPHIHKNTIHSRSFVISLCLFFQLCVINGNIAPSIHCGCVCGSLIGRCVNNKNYIRWCGRGCRNDFVCGEMLEKTMAL